MKVPRWTTSDRRKMYSTLHAHASVCARGVSDGSFTAEFVQAPAFAMSLVAERCCEASRVEVGATGTVLMDHAIVRKLWAAEFVERRELAHRDVFENDRQQVVRVRRTTRQIDDGLA